MLSPTKCRQLVDVCEIHGLRNLISLPTCFKSTENPSLIDLVLTNSPRRFSSSFNLRNSISDFHNLVGCCTKLYVPQADKGDVVYRSFKHFNELQYKQDMMYIPFHVSDIFDDFDDQFWFNSKLISNVVDAHAPLKKRKCKARPVPFMNSEYRKACFRKSMLRNRFFTKGRNNVNWEAYRRARNDATKLRNTSMSKYFDDKCNSKVKQDPKTFWPTIRPYFTDKKCGGSSQVITLNTGGKIINDPLLVSNSFNNFFSTVADHIGNSPDLRSYSNFSEIPHSYANHESIIKIKEFMQNENHGTFEFHQVSEEGVENLIKKLKSNKSTGFDGVPPRLLKIASTELSHPIANMINKSITLNHFPSDCKKSEVNPLHKKKDTLIRNNYRPVSVLPCISKLFERCYYDQMYEYMESILSIWLAAYRKNYGCQHVLVRFLEDMKKALENKEHFGALLSDLSKAFDCLSHPLLLCKLQAYGFSVNSCQLIFSYLSDRQQRVKIGCARSEWVFMLKGVPQGSILGPLLFNIFMNDLFFFLEEQCTLYNYADDNNIGYSHRDINHVLQRLTSCANITINWFNNNEMEANASKFQGIIKVYGDTDVPTTIKVMNDEINFSKEITLLGVDIDNKLTFDSHVSKICRRSGFSLRALERIAKHLSNDSKRYVYNAFIASHFSYCNIVWHFTSIQNILKMERINKRALRIIFDDDDSTYPELLNKAGLKDLYTSRIDAIALEMFKTDRKINPAFLHNLFMNQDHNYDLRNSVQLDPRIRCIQLEPPIPRTSIYGLNSFVYQGTKIWNSLPLEAKISNSIIEFKNIVRALPSITCTCNQHGCISCAISKL